MRLAILSLVPLAALSRFTGAARADDKERFILLEENDSLFFNSDKHYTQGLRASILGPDLGPESAWNGPFDLTGSIAPVFSPDGQAGEIKRRYALLLGQSIFTPKNILLKPPDPRDRPYAGWLYTGVSLLQESRHRMLENLELDVGIVGPGAVGKQVQNDFHQFIGIQPARGWSSQIQNEPGLMLSYERLWRVPLIGDGRNGVDIVPQAGATVGNVFTYGALGGLLRVGKNLQADYGPIRVRPALSGTDYFDGDQLDGKLGYYFFAGVQGRVVGRNVFLDGNSFRTSPSVPKKNYVADLQVGFTVFWSTAIRAGFSVMRRTEEFRGQRTPDEVGTASLAFSW
jgi:hypothetical protein